MAQASVGRGVPGVETGTQFAERLRVRRESGYGPLVAPDVLSHVFPSRGIERGQVYHLIGDASLSFLSALIAPATQWGSWCALVNLAHAHCLSMHEYGVALHRIVNVSVRRSGVWGNVVGALVDGFDVVAVSDVQCSHSEARRIVARAKAQSTVLFLCGHVGPFQPDVSVVASTQQWEFSSHAVSRCVDVSVTTRRHPSVQSSRILLPNHVGALAGLS